MDVKRAVKQRYGQIARGSATKQQEQQAEAVAATIGYSQNELSALPEGANLGLGCGNPLAMAEIQPGDTVLDLGSGGGLDCFLAAQRVGPSGRVIGVDMTEEMVAKARSNAAQGNYANVEFRLGEIEHLPIEDSSVDLVISNCVLNLVPDKAQAFREIARVLKPGGRVMVSDILRRGELPAALLDDLDTYVACVGGAIEADEYLSLMRAAGLTEVEIISETDAADLLAGSCDCGCEISETGISIDDLRGKIVSAAVRARK